MRLIDTENFSKVMKDYFTDMITHHKYNVDCVDCNADLQHLLDEQPTAYDVDKAVKELEKAKDEIASEDYCRSINDKEKCDDKNCFECCAEYLIEIVKQGGVSDDVCEWHKVKNGTAYKSTTHAEIHDARVLDWCRCPYCGKRIKVVE